MSAPFGPSPKLREYIVWFRSLDGCEVQEGYNNHRKAVIRFVSPDGYAFIVGQPDNEPLSQSLVAALDRRLKIDAPFPKTPQPYR